MYFQNIDSAIQVPHDSDDYCYDDWLLLLCTPRECHIYVIPGGLEQENVIQQNSNFSIIGFSQNMSLILSACLCAAGATVKETISVEDWRARSERESL